LVKTVRTVTSVQVRNEELDKKPEYDIGSYLQVYSGYDEGWCFTVKDVRYNHDCKSFEYQGNFGLYSDWKRENMLVLGR